MKTDIRRTLRATMQHVRLAVTEPFRLMVTQRLNLLLGNSLEVSVAVCGCVWLWLWLWLWPWLCAWCNTGGCGFLGCR